MKQTVKLSLFSIYSLIQDLEKMTPDSVSEERYKAMQEALNMLKETFMPLIDQYKDCCCMPDVDVDIDTDSDDSEKEKNKDYWEQKRFELIKSALQGRLAAVDTKYGFEKSYVRKIAREAILMADIMIEELKESRR